MLNKKIAFLLSLGILLSLINIILVYIYDYQINKFITEEYYQETRMFTRLKTILGDSINSLQFIVLAFDVLYLTFYILLNNDQFTKYFGIDIESIPVQNTSDYANYTLEAFFASFIKLLSCILTIFYCSQTVQELNKVLSRAENNSIDSEGVNTILFGKNSIIVLLTFNSINMLIFVVIYGIKLFEIGEKKLNKAREQTEALYELVLNQSRQSQEPLNQ